MFCRTEYDMKVIGRNLRRLREKKHLSVEQVREYLCLGSVQAVYKYEAGAGYPQADTLLALMELYDAGVNEITQEYEEEQCSSFDILGTFYRKNVAVLITFNDADNMLRQLKTPLLVIVATILKIVAVCSFIYHNNGGDVQ